MSSDDYRWHYDYPRLAFDTGFSFETYRSKSLDKIIGSANVEHIVKERDVAAIEKYIPAVIEFSLDNDQTSVLDPTFVKVFRITQLSVQYLLFCKKYLDNSVIHIKEEYQKNNEENKNLKRQAEELNQAVSNYKKQIKELKASLNSQIVANQNNSVFQCRECPKAFSTEEYLLAHIKRRHESFGIVVAPSHASFQTETDKLQLEIKELKERLNNSERFVSHNDLLTIKEISVKSNNEQNTFLTELQDKFERLKMHVDSELKILQTQKFEKEKYEKWFETFLSNRLNITNNETTKPVMATTGCQGEIITNNCGSQTELMELCKKCQTGNLEEQAAKNNSPYNRKEVGVELQEQLHLETQNRLQKFEELLNKKVSGSLEKLENQMQTFLIKINDIEEQRTKTLLSTSMENLDQPIPKLSESKRFHKKVTAHKNVVISKLDPPIGSPEPNKTIEASPTVNTIRKPTPRNRSNVVVIKKYCSSSGESDGDTTFDGFRGKDNIQEVVLNKPVVKISATSTLGRRSLTSLKEVAFTPEVLAQLQKEVEKVMDSRLQDVGVNSKYKSISVRPYQHALGLISHEASVVQKNVANYMKIRRQILKDLNKQVMERSKVSEPSRNSTLKTLLSRFKKPFRSEPQSVIKNFNSTPSTTIDAGFSESDVESSVKLAGPTNVAEYSTDSEVVNTQKQTDNFIMKPINVQKEDDAEMQTKSVLKNFTVSGSLPKKKVIFDLDSPELKENVKPVMPCKGAEAGGSTTSLASSVLDGSRSSPVKFESLPKKKQEAYDSSDWELSEVSSK